MSKAETVMTNKKNYAFVFFCIAAFTSIVACIFASPFIWADTSNSNSNSNSNNSIEEIIVTGLRNLGRPPGDSPSPVDIISSASLAQQAHGDMPDLIATVIPSYSVRATGNAASLVRPTSLRGLPSDATLVMVNGKRRHRAAVISFIGAGVSDGAQGVDVGMIPVAAVRQLEVLRDGAAAQYGSNAIAGVMNFILKDDSEGCSVDVKFSETYQGDGDAVQISGNVGLPLTANGFVNLTLQYGQADAYQRSVQRDDAAELVANGNSAVANPAQAWGSQDVPKDFTSFVNMGLDVSASSQWYAFANYVVRQVETGFSFRNPNTRGGVFGVPLILAGAEPDANGNEIPFLVDAENNTISREQIIGSDGTIRSDIGAQPWARRYDRLVADTTSNGLNGNCPQTDINNNGGLDVRDAVGLTVVQSDSNCFVFNEVYPGGFTPRFGSKLNDFSVFTGIRGTLESGLRWDLSTGGGRNEAEFYIHNTLNASLGPDSPSEFTSGIYVQEEKNINADFAYSLDSKIRQNFAVGGEWREEQFQVKAGDQASWQPVPFADQGFSIGANGFSGFSPDVLGKWSRSNVALYGDYEAQWDRKFLLSAALGRLRELWLHH
ncbi:MAG: iron complex outermembrane receptor protein [Flavobacteriales bacterium]|jgi:iron complex outermembrane receptor protein